MTIDFTRDEVWFLKALRAAGEHGRIVRASAYRVGLARLVEERYVTEHAVNSKGALYNITNLGRQALTNAS
jgi:DNA-binding PadR family transcriptional regulator